MSCTHECCIDLFQPDKREPYWEYGQACSICFEQHFDILKEEPKGTFGTIEYISLAVTKKLPYRNSKNANKL